MLRAEGVARELYESEKAKGDVGWELVLAAAIAFGSMFYSTE